MNSLCAHGQEGLMLWIWQTIKAWLFSTKAWSKNSVAPCPPPCGVANRQITPRLFFSAENCDWRTERRPLSAPKRGDTGLGLAELLVASGLGIVIGMASLDTLKVTMQTAQTVKTDLEVQKLAYEVKTFFSDEVNCKNTLQPLHLSDKANQSGRVLVSAGGPDLKQIGGWTPSLIEIQGVELLNEGTDKNHPQRTLAVLYTKPYARGRETLGGESCSTTDKSGCYYHTCVVDYRCDDDNCGLLSDTDSGSDKCEPVTCHKGKGFQGMSCDGEFEYLRRVNSDGSRECGDLRDFCHRSRSALSFNSAGEIDCQPLLFVSAANSESPLSCPEGQIVQEVKSNGEIVCTGLCEERQRWDKDREVLGEKKPGCVCTGGTVSTGTAPNLTCECPPAKPHWHEESGQCHACPDRKIRQPDGTCKCSVRAYWHPTLERCECNDGTWDEDIGDCKCPDQQIWYDVYPTREDLDIWVCGACGTGNMLVTPHDSVFVNGRCECPAQRPHLYQNRCHSNCQRGKSVINGVCACPSDRPHYYNNNCQQCPPSTPYYYDNQCHRCPQNKPYYHSHQCNQCPSGQTFRTNRAEHILSVTHKPLEGKCCPNNKEYYYGGQCQKCYWGRSGSNCVKRCGDKQGTEPEHRRWWGQEWGGNRCICRKSKYPRLGPNGRCCKNCYGGKWCKYRRPQYCL